MHAFLPVVRLLISIPKGLDLHRHTPVEILHVLLLGPIKYFWRDAVSRVSAEGKQTLKARLASVSISGLDISSLRAQTLVQYAGSLVGRDFRAILQVAPVVLHGLIPEAAYEAWLALCRLAPMVFQPCIDNTVEFLVCSAAQYPTDCSAEIPPLGTSGEPGP